MPIGPWLHCTPCGVVWLGLDDCWSCGRPGRVGDPPRVKQYAQPIGDGARAAILPM